MFHLKLIPKKTDTLPLLTNILKFLHAAFLFVLTNIKKFYDPKDSNIAFMTLIQSPMINAINTGGFLLNDETSPTEMVDRLLSLLNQYLISNKSLHLNKTFKVYLKILSAEHSKLKTIQRKKIKKVTKTVVGCSTEHLKAFWAIDVPYIEFMQNCCLLLTTVLAVTQHTFFETNGQDKKFKYMELILSTNKAKFRYARNLLVDSVNEIFENTLIQPQTDPYDLLETIKILSQYFNCQFFIFESSPYLHRKLFLRYPKNFDCSKKPIFLYKPHQSNHVVFIRNLTSFFKFNGKTCLVCKKTFKSVQYPHFCKENNNCCFVCHRHFQKPTTYINSYLEKYFCDSKINKSIKKKCHLCNVLLESQSCANAHKRLCNSKGFFGYFCDECKRFTYSSFSTTSADLKESHVCSQRTCKICFKMSQPGHLCKLLLEKYPNYHSHLAFIHIEAFENEIYIASFLIENSKTKTFENIMITDPLIKPYMSFTPEHLTFDYYGSLLKNSKKKPQKDSQERLQIMKNIEAMPDSFQKSFLKILIKERAEDMTIIISDEENEGMVSCNLWCKILNA